MLKLLLQKTENGNTLDEGSVRSVVQWDRIHIHTYGKFWMNYCSMCEHTRVFRAPHCNSAISDCLWGTVSSFINKHHTFWESVFFIESFSKCLWQTPNLLDKRWVWQRAQLESCLHTTQRVSHPMHCWTRSLQFTTAPMISVLLTTHKRFSHLFHILSMWAGMHRPFLLKDS